MNEAHGPVKLDKSSSDPDAIRGREQINIRRTKSEGGSSVNAINSIGNTIKKLKNI